MTTQPTAQPAKHTHVTLVLEPERDKRTNAYRFPVAVSVPPKAGSKDKEHAVEVLGKFLSPGANLVTVEDFEAMQTNPFFQRCINKKVITVYLPSGSKVTGTTADYALDDAFAIIDQSNDVDWLQRCVAKDDRDGVASACQNRVKEIEEMMNREGGND